MEINVTKQDKHCWIFIYSLFKVFSGHQKTTLTFPNILKFDLQKVSFFLIHIFLLAQVICYLTRISYICFISLILKYFRFFNYQRDHSLQGEGISQMSAILHRLMYILNSSWWGRSQFSKKCLKLFTWFMGGPLLFLLF